MHQTEILSDLKKLLGQSFVYGVGSISVKLVGFLLIPLFTRYLSVGDYGILAVTSSVTSILAILFSLELRGAVNYFYFRTKDIAARDESTGTIWISMLGIAVTMTFLLDWLGRPLFGWLFRSIPYDPYLRLAVWSALFVVVSQFPQVILQTKEKPRTFVLMILVNTVLSGGLSMVFVIAFRLGAYGYLLGTLVASILMTVPYVLIALRNSRPTFRWALFGSVLLYSLPLVPHSLSAWLLEFSDRVIMEKYVSLSALGIYSLAYQFGSIVNLAASALSTAWVPMIFRIVETKGSHERIPQLITYFVLITSFVFLLVTLFVREVNLLATREAFHGAYKIAYWIALAQFFQGLYYVPVNFLFVRKQTRLIPVITLGSAAVDVTLNLLLLPRYGVLAAAWAGLTSKIMLLLLAGFISQSIYPIQYEVSRLGKMFTAMILISTCGLLISTPFVALNLALKAGLFVSYPVALHWFGFFTPDEKVEMRGRLHDLQGFANRLLNR